MPTGIGQGDGRRRRGGGGTGGRTHRSPHAISRFWRFFRVDGGRVREWGLGMGMGMGRGFQTEVRDRVAPGRVCSSARARRCLDRRSPWDHQPRRSAVSACCQTIWSTLRRGGGRARRARGNDPRVYARISDFIFSSGGWWAARGACEPAINASSPES